MWRHFKEALFVFRDRKSLSMPSHKIVVYSLTYNCNVELWSPCRRKEWSWAFPSHPATLLVPKPNPKWIKGVTKNFFSSFFLTTTIFLKFPSLSAKESLISPHPHHLITSCNKTHFTRRSHQRSRQRSKHRLEMDPSVKCHPQAINTRIKSINWAREMWVLSLCVWSTFVCVVVVEEKNDRVDVAKDSDNMEG